MKALKNCITADKSHALFLSAKVHIWTLYLCISRIVDFEMCELT